MSKPSALIVLPEAPYPLRGGGALRSASVLNYLSAQYNVDAIVFRGNSIPPSLLRSTHLVELPFHSRSAWARVARNVGRAVRGVPPLVDRFSGFEEPMKLFLAGRKWDLGIIEHFWAASYAPLLRKHCGRLVLDLHNIESVLSRRFARSQPVTSSWLFHRFAAANERLEREWLPSFDLLLVSSGADRELVRRFAPTAVVPNTLPEQPQPRVAKTRSIVFSGNLAYEPNKDAVRYFAQAIWPVLANRYGDLTWRLIGMGKEAIAGFVRSSPRVELVGEVDDAITHIAEGLCSVVPLRSGSGTRLKILEAWAAGTPVVSTSIGAEGLDAVSGEHLTIADEPQAFADAVSALIDDERRSAAMAASARRLFEERYTWKSSAEALDHWLSFHSSNQAI